MTTLARIWRIAVAVSADTTRWRFEAAVGSLPSPVSVAAMSRGATYTPSLAITL
ncbi:MAG: hypothetical protein IPM45_18495 [Acidimicrobiales bacterium]|nr:hypothetical protein [Acidimicrobiales bacterium]